MKISSVTRLMGGTAVAIILSAGALWAQTSTGQTQQGTQAQQQLPKQSGSGTQGQAQTGSDTQQQTGKQQQTQTGTDTQQGTAAKKKQKTGTETEQTQDQQKGQKQQQTEGQKQDQDQQQTQKGGADVSVTAEQRTKIKEEIRSVNVEPVTKVDFNISVGVAVPSTIVLHTIPAEIVEIVPHYHGYRFFLLPDGRIVIVEPSSLRIVLILD